MTKNLLSNSLSMMSIREYMNIIGKKEFDLENGWGMIIDIDLFYEISKNNKDDKILNKHLLKYIPALNIIKETPSICSIKSTKSMNNLIEETNTNETNNKYKYKYNNLFSFICINIIGVIMLPFVYYYVVY